MLSLLRLPHWSYTMKDKVSFKQLKKFASPKATKHLAKAGKLSGGHFIIPQPTKTHVGISIVKAVNDDLVSIGYACAVLGISQEDLLRLVQQGVLEAIEIMDVHAYDASSGTFTGVNTIRVRRADVMHLKRIEEAEQQAAIDELPTLHDEDFIYIASSVPFKSLDVKIGYFDS